MHKNTQKKPHIETLDNITKTRLEAINALKYRKAIFILNSDPKFWYGLGDLGNGIDVITKIHLDKSMSDTNLISILDFNAQKRLVYVITKYKSKDGAVLMKDELEMSIRDMENVVGNLLLDGVKLSK